MVCVGRARAAPRRFDAAWLCCASDRLARRSGGAEAGFAVRRRQTAPAGGDGRVPQDVLHKSAKVCSLRLDEESLGTAATTRAAYERVLRSKWRRLRCCSTTARISKNGL